MKELQMENGLCDLSGLLSGLKWPLAISKDIQMSLRSNLRLDLSSAQKVT